MTRKKFKNSIFLQIALEKIQLGKSNFHQVKFIFCDNIIFNLRLYNNF